MDNREIKFLDYNSDGLMENLLAVEEHARILDNTQYPGHSSCIQKHLLLITHHSNEGISHTLDDNFKRNIFKDVRKDTEELRKDMMINGFSQKDFLVKLRNIRKKAEMLNPAYNTNNCMACQVSNKKYISEYSNTKDLNTSSIYIEEDTEFKNNPKIGGIDKMRAKNIGVLTAGTFTGKFGTWGTYELDKLILAKDSNNPNGVIASTPLYKRPSVWINILGGLGLSLSSLYLMKRKPSMQLFLASTGAGMMTKSVDYMREMIGGKYEVAGTIDTSIGQSKVFIPAMPTRNAGRINRVPVRTSAVRRSNIEVF